jgi:hypothetical protein
MFYSNATYIGIDPTAGENPFVYAVLNHDLDVQVLSAGSIDDTIAFAAGQRQAVIAVCSPEKTNNRIMADHKFRESISPRPSPGRWEDFRFAEYILRQHNILIPQTCSVEENCPGWMKMGFLVYKRLYSIGYRNYINNQSEKTYLEVYPHASYTVLLNFLPFKKRTIEGRLQRQLVLFESGVNIPDPMRIFEEITRHRLLSGILPLENLYTMNELDALIAAYTAWKVINRSEEITFVGDHKEGQIVLPVPKMRDQYHQAVL